MGKLRKTVDLLSKRLRAAEKEIQVLRFMLKGKKFYYHVSNGYTVKNLYIESVNVHETELIKTLVVIPDIHKIVENDDYLEIWQVHDNSLELHSVYTVEVDKLVPVDIKLYSAYLAEQNRQSA